MAIKRYFILFITFTALIHFANAQENNLIIGTNFSPTEETYPTDTVIPATLDESELNQIISLREQFEKQNRLYTVPVKPNVILHEFMTIDEVKLSDEALYWVNYQRDPATIIGENVTLKDTILISRMFLPIIFQGKMLPDKLSYYDEDAWKTKIDIPQPYLMEPIFEDHIFRWKLTQNVYKYVESNHPDYFRYSHQDLPKEQLVAKEMEKAKYEPEMIQMKSEADFTDVDAPVKFLPERRYWTSHFESSIQFAQNYISPNWHKGGVSALNLNNRQYFVYNYNKDKVQFTNELEWKTSVYTAPKDTVRDYKIGNDVIRLHSNIGYKAFSKWFYTFDATVQTQLFTSFAENSDNKLSGFLAPLNINLGLGMKYDLEKSFPKNRHKKVSFSANIAPLSYTFMYSRDHSNMDLGRHGFNKNPETGEYEHKLSQFGSTINATLNFQFNRNISWYSRFYYFTSYNRILGEFDNRLTMAISRFFSTTITLNLRYDDAVAKREDFDSFLQINELLSFGFNYKW